MMVEGQHRERLRQQAFARMKAGIHLGGPPYPSARNFITALPDSPRPERSSGPNRSAAPDCEPYCKRSARGKMGQALIDSPRRFAPGVGAIRTRSRSRPQRIRSWQIA